MPTPPPLPTPRHGIPLDQVPVDVPLQLVPEVERLVADARRPRPWFDLPLGIGLGLFAALMTTLFTIVVPRFEAIYRDFSTRLPTPTVMLLNITRFLNATYAWVVFWVIAVVVPILVARLRPWPPQRRGPALKVAVILSVLLIGLAVVALYVTLQLPMINLIQSVSGPKR